MGLRHNPAIVPPANDQISFPIASFVSGRLKPTVLTIRRLRINAITYTAPTSRLFGRVWKMVFMVFSFGEIDFLIGQSAQYFDLVTRRSGHFDFPFGSF